MLQPWVLLPMMGFLLLLVSPSIQARNDGIVWQPCPTPHGYPPLPANANMLCGNLTVPLDHSHPSSGGSITLAVAKRPANGTADTPHLGSLFLNPGGPGGPGALWLEQNAYGGFSNFPTAVLESYDLVSWDPRGTGSSTAVKCFKDIDDYWSFIYKAFPDIPSDSPEIGNIGLWVQGSTYPTTKKQALQYMQLFEKVHERCEKRAGKLLKFISTEDTARDLDLLREAVGDEKINYYGLSYGTLLGQVYANLFPGKIRSMVIDGNVDAVGWFNRTALAMTYRFNQDLGTYMSFDTLLYLCGTSAPGSCAFSEGSYFETRAKWNKLWEVIQARPIYISPDENLLLSGVITSSALGEGVASSMSRYSEFEGIAMLLQALWVNQSAPWPEAPPSRPYIDIEYMNLALRYTAIACAETATDAEGGTGSPAQLKKLATYLFQESVGEAARSKVFSGVRMWAGGDGIAQCSVWTSRAKHIYSGPWNKPTSATILVIGNRFDYATPFEQSRRVAIDLLANASLLSINGLGHCMLGNPSACGRGYLAAYRVNGVLPSPDVICQQDYVPFGSTIEFR